MAEQIGVDETSIYNWENNQVRPEIKFIPRIIEFLGYALYDPSLSLIGRLKQCRQAIGLSQKKMAQALGIDESTLSHWETRRSHLGRKFLEMVKTALNSGVEFLEMDDSPNRTQQEINIQ